MAYLGWTKWKNFQVKGSHSGYGDSDYPSYCMQQNSLPRITTSGGYSQSLEYSSSRSRQPVISLGCTELWLEGFHCQSGAADRGNFVARCTSADQCTYCFTCKLLFGLLHIMQLIPSHVHVLTLEADPHLTRWVLNPSLSDWKVRFYMRTIHSIIARVDHVQPASIHSHTFRFSAFISRNIDQSTYLNSVDLVNFFSTFARGVGGSI